MGRPGPQNWRSSSSGPRRSKDGHGRESRRGKARRPDPSATAVVERPVTDSQGQLFSDATRRTPTPTRSPPYRPPARLARPGPLAPDPGRPRGPGRGRRRSDARTGQGGRHRQERDGEPQDDRHDDRTTRPRRVVEGAARDPGLDWVRLGHLQGRHRRLRGDGRHDDRPLLGQHRRHRKAPSFAGILNPNSSQKEFLLGPAQVDVGAGGTKVILTSGKRT